tara:strand:+ start:298 stop:501 length:204 start_codon:yes stop_codon:yes gene_type:complete
MSLVEPLVVRNPIKPINPITISAYINKCIDPSLKTAETIIGKIYEALKKRIRILNKLIIDFKFISLF